MTLAATQVDVLTHTPTRRRYLMCRPTHFDVVYAINPWMDTSRPVDHALVMAQWETLRSLYLGLGHDVEVIEGAHGLPDMVYAANGATVVNGRGLAAHFRFPQRRAEAGHYRGWLNEHGITVVPAVAHNEGEGDFLVMGDRILAGTGFRADAASHAELAAFSGMAVESLELVDPSYYHLDTAIAVLGPHQIAYLPSAFSSASLARLRVLYPGAIEVSRSDAAVLGLNVVSDGRHVVVPSQAVGFHGQLRAAGYIPVPVDLSELLKGGGAVKCATMELR